MSLIPTDIGRSLHKKIGDLCPLSIAKNNAQNHCAHYVSHIMGYELAGPTCKNFTWADRQTPVRGATLRVDDLFAQAPEVGLLSAKPAALTECLIFVTLAANVTANAAGTLVMGNNPKKHVGILTGGKVYNYSNTGQKVVADLLAAFQSKFTTTYATAGTTVEFYYGKFI